MKITVRNLGVLKEETAIDIKPLTIFIGPNNAGKTWLAYALAGILDSYGLKEYIQAYIENQVPHNYAPLDHAIEAVVAEGNATIDLRQFANDYAETYFNNVAIFASNWMNRFFSTQFARFADMDISLNLDDVKAQLLERISQYSQRTSITIGPKGALLTLQKRRGEDKLYAFTSIESPDTGTQVALIGKSFPTEEVKERFTDFVFTALQQSLYPQIRILPTERTTLVTFRFSRRIEQLKLNDRVVEALEVLIQELDMRALAEQSPARESIWPVSSFVNLLNALFTTRFIEREEREKKAKSDPQVRKYIQLAEVLEKQILGGNLDFSTPEPDPGREVLFQPARDVRLEIPIASSMVKELSPLVLYLRHLAQPDELLIIDEPEMNLHPEAQAKIIEFLAMLVNAGINVLITTHSPYITDHLTNLIKAEKHEDQENISGAFFLKRSDAFIAKDKVSVYGMSEGEVKNVLDDDGMINWSTFGEVSERISNIYFQL